MIYLFKFILILAWQFGIPLHTGALAGSPPPPPSGCPAGFTCYYVASNGSDSNDGLSEASGHPWLHAPGMPNCSANCATLQSTGTGGANLGGTGLIFRGGDTWHFGDSSATPYTGGSWDLYGWFAWAYTHTTSSCAYEGTQSGCVYVGVDTGWYSGGSWARPTLTEDNPPSTGFVSSCTYQIANSGSYGSKNMVNMPAYAILDNFEMTGKCVSDLNSTSGSSNTYVSGWASSTDVSVAFLENAYIHGWTATSTAGTGSGSHPVTILGGGSGTLQVFDHMVIDGSDSDPEVAAWATFPWFYHMRDSMVRYIGQGVGSHCHDVHDNTWEDIFYTELDGHINTFECNADASGSTPNVFYNNVLRHFDPSFDNGEIVWFCPNTTPEYWFNNLMYDVLTSGTGQAWNVVGPPIYPSCVNTGGQFMFNNTLVDVSQPCYLSNSSTHGIYLSVFNEHLINSPFDTGSPQCIGGPASGTNIAMSDATATSQGYTTGSPGTASSNNCAHDSTKPCTPTAGSNGTVGIGANHQDYCTTLASFSGEPAIGTDAAVACQHSTTDGCAYNASTHSMNCPAQTPVVRPVTSPPNWDAGAYQWP